VWIDEMFIEVLWGNLKETINGKNMIKKKDKCKKIFWIWDVQY
jgi:hypothetical protein